MREPLRGGARARRGPGEHTVGRVDQHEIVAPALTDIGGEAARRILASELRADQPELLEVALDRRQGLPVGLHEDDPGSPARERLEAHRARAGVEIGNARAVERADQAERCLADTVGGRPRRRALRSHDARALAGAGDDPHPRPRLARPTMCPRTCARPRRRGGLRPRRARAPPRAPARGGPDRSAGA